jgi:hypothetical protein
VVVSDDTQANQYPVTPYTSTSQHPNTPTPYFNIKFDIAAPIHNLDLLLSEKSLYLGIEKVTVLSIFSLTVSLFQQRFLKFTD